MANDIMGVGRDLTPCSLSHWERELSMRLSVRLLYAASKPKGAEALGVSL